MRFQRLARSLTDRVLGGVCGGLGSTIGIDPWWVRSGFVILGLFTAGTGLLIYLALWFALPPQSLGDLPASRESQPRAANPETIILIGGAVIVMGLIVLARNLGILSSENGDAFLPLVVIAFGLTLLAKQWWRSA